MILYLQFGTIQDLRHPLVWSLPVEKWDCCRIERVVVDLCVPLETELAHCINENSRIHWLLFLKCCFAYSSLFFRPVYYLTNGFYCSWSFLHRHSVAMANSCAQSLGMPLTTVTRTGKLDHVWTMARVSVCPGTACGWTSTHTFMVHGYLAWKQLDSTSSGLSILPLFAESVQEKVALCRLSGPLFLEGRSPNPWEVNQFCELVA